MKKLSFSVFGNINIDKDKWDYVSQKLINVAQSNSQPMLRDHNWLFVVSDELSFAFRQTGFFEINVFKGKLDIESSISLGKDFVSQLMIDNNIMPSSVDWILLKSFNKPNRVVEIDIGVP